MTKVIIKILEDTIKRLKKVERKAKFSFTQCKARIGVHHACHRCELPRGHSGMHISTDDGHLNGYERIKYQISW